MANSKPILSVLIPSRYRFDRLVKCIDSYVDNASDKNNVEFIIKFDTDDTESYSRINEIRKDINIKYLVTDRLKGYQSLHTFANYMYLLATGTWVMFMTDDAEFTTKDWDLTLKAVKHRYVCLCPYEGDKVSEVAPIVSLQACHALGYFCLNHAQDRWFNSVYSAFLIPVDISFTHYLLNDQSNEDRRNSVAEDDWNYLLDEIKKAKEFISINNL
jgi:hypothetical protein